MICDVNGWKEGGSGVWECGISVEGIMADAKFGCSSGEVVEEPVRQKAIAQEECEIYGEEGEEADERERKVR